MEKENVFFGIDDYMAMYAPYIKRAEARELAQCYVVGLMMDAAFPNESIRLGIMERSPMPRSFLGALKQESSLPDVRHQIALYLMRVLI